MDLENNGNAQKDFYGLILKAELIATFLIFLQKHCWKNKNKHAIIVS